MSERIDFSWKTVTNENKKTPPFRSNMAGGVYEDHLWILMGAGAGSGRSNEVWKFSFKDNEWIPVICTGEIPTGRDGHTASYTGAGKFLLFGGQGIPTANLKAHKTGGEGGTSKIKTMLAREVFNDVHEFNCVTGVWTPLFPHGTPPISRRLHSANFVNYSDDSIGVRLPATISHGPNTHGTTKHHNHKPETHKRGSVEQLPSSHRTSMEYPHHSKPTTGHNSNIGIPDKSLVIYGGCGIEPSKKTEQVFNDLWIFATEKKEGKGEWINVTTRGAVPRPQSGHKSELVGDTMVVVGGIPATPFSLSKADQGLSSTLATIISDVMTLNVRTLTWTYLDLRDPIGRRVKLNLHGHSLSKELHHDPTSTSVLIFGGKTTCDTREIIPDRKPVITINTAPALWQLDVITGTTTSIGTKPNHAPENRYGHLGVSMMYMPEKSTTPGGNNARRSNRDQIKPHPVLVVFGGSALDAGGFVDPEIYTLYRSIRPEEKEEGNPYGGSTSSYAGSGTHSDPSYSNSIPGGGALSPSPTEHSTIPGMLPMDQDDYGLNDSDQFGGRRPQKTIWQRMHGGNTLSDGISVVSTKQPSSSWSDLKLALSYPTTQRNGSANIILRPEVITTAENNVLANGGSLPPQPTSLTLGRVISNKKNDKATRALLRGPDVIRIGTMLAKDIDKMEMKKIAHSPSRRSLAATLLTGENKHNFQTQTLQSSVNTKMLRTLSVGAGAKSLLGPESTLDLDAMRVKFRRPGYAGLNADSMKALPPEVISSQIMHNKQWGDAIYPMVKGLDMKEAKTAFMNKYPLHPDTGPFLVASALSFNN